MGVIRVIFYLFLITSLPDTAGGEGNLPLKRHHAILHSNAITLSSPRIPIAAMQRGMTWDNSRASAYL